MTYVATSVVNHDVALIAPVFSTFPATLFTVVFAADFPTVFTAAAPFPTPPVKNSYSLYNAPTYLYKNIGLRTSLPETCP